MNFLSQLPNYHAWIWRDYLFWALWGFLGACIRIAHNNSPIRRPRRTEEGDIELNAIGDIFVGTMIGMLADHNLLFSVAAGAGAPLVLEVFLGRRGAGWLAQNWLKEQAKDD